MYHKPVEEGRQADRRANQKSRTRTAISEAALELRRQGRTPTIAEAAEQARVSRATAYRYFPTQEALNVELQETARLAEPVEEALARLDSDDIEERLLLVLDTFNPTLIEVEADMRRILLVYQDTWLRAHRAGDEPPTVREGRRMRWLDQVLQPANHLPADRRQLLQAALALTIGGDSISIMKDVCKLDDQQALATLRWAAQTLLRASLAEDATN
jgi:AcrR family transcriptional regulator